MEKKQTAVEWLKSEINKRGPKENNPPQWLKELYEQAKQMEKEQILQAHIAGQPFASCQSEKAEQYYNETYGGTDE